MNEVGSVVDKRWAYLKYNEDFIFVETYSGRWSYLPDPLGKRIFISGSAPDEQLGKAIIDAIVASRVILPDVNPEFYDVMGRIVPEYNLWVRQVMDDYGYKTKRAMFKNMKSCLVEATDGTLVIQPSHHEKLEAWSGRGIDPDDYVTITTTQDALSVGAGARLALSRCT